MNAALCVFNRFVFNRWCATLRPSLGQKQVTQLPVCYSPSWGVQNNYNSFDKDETIDVQIPYRGFETMRPSVLALRLYNIKIG